MKHVPDEDDLLDLHNLEQKCPHYSNNVHHLSRLLDLLKSSFKQYSPTKKSFINQKILDLFL